MALDNYVNQWTNWLSIHIIMTVALNFFLYSSDVDANYHIGDLIG